MRVGMAIESNDVYSGDSSWIVAGIRNGCDNVNKRERYALGGAYLHSESPKDGRRRFVVYGT